MATLYKRDDRPDDKRWHILIKDVRGKRRRIVGYESKRATEELANRLDQLRIAPAPEPCPRTTPCVGLKRNRPINCGIMPNSDSFNKKSS